MRAKTSFPPTFSDPLNSTIAERAAADTIRRMGRVLATAAQRGAVDLGDERVTIDLLAASGWHPVAIETYLDAATDRARGIVADPSSIIVDRASGMVADAIGAAAVIGGGLAAYALLTGSAKASTALPGCPEADLLPLLVGGMAAVTFGVVIAFGFAYALLQRRAAEQRAAIASLRRRTYPISGAVFPDGATEQVRNGDR